VTDRGYTGHKHNDDLGLIYMNARYYAPYINRFISADTIVPDPTNPQQYNRYSYVLNNALKYTDPSGHSCYNPSMGGPCILSDGTGNNMSRLPRPLYQGKNSIVSFSPIEQVPNGWRTVQVNYREDFPSYATTASAPNQTVNIYYKLSVDSISGLLPFEIVARVLLSENVRGLLFEDERFAAEVGEHWPQDQVAPAYIINRNAARSGQTVAEHVGPNRTADPELNTIHPVASDNAHIIALGVEQGWLADPSFGADWYWHGNTNSSFDGAPYLDDTWVGDYANGWWWQPTYGPSRVIYPAGIESTERTPYR
jgi:RHS repeat-associated protein